MNSYASSTVVAGRILLLLTICIALDQALRTESIDGTNAERSIASENTDTQRVRRTCAGIWGSCNVCLSILDCTDKSYCSLHR